MPEDALRASVGMGLATEERRVSRAVISLRLKGIGLGGCR